MHKPKNDRALRFYNEVLGLDHLHYGIWNPDDELSLNSLKKAQQRYEDVVVATIPNEAKKILDVGCGTGELSKRLVAEGYDIEGLSPDINQKDLYPVKTGGRPFNYCRFEEYTAQQKFDCIIMSESGQYIPLHQLFANAAKTLKKGGHLISIDYFVLNHATGTMAKSGHNLELFYKEAEINGFTIIKDEDITDSVLKTLELAKQITDRTLTAISILTERTRFKYPRVTRFINWLIRKKKQKFDERLELLDAEKFKNAKRYKLFLFEYKGN